MKIMLRYISLGLILVSPLFSALLTDDLMVISPTGMPFFHHQTGLCTCFSKPDESITIRFIETSTGVLIVREFSNSGMSELINPRENLNTSIIIFNPASEQDSEEAFKLLNVNLE